MKPINKYLEEILQALQDMIDNEIDTSETRSDAINAAVQPHVELQFSDFVRILE